MTEVWKEVPGYEGILSVSNLGRVKRLNYRNTGKDRILSINVKKNIVCTINVGINGKLKTLSVHRLVATAFIPNPNNYPCVNHKDENRLNNTVENLEWCTYEYNNNYMTRNKRISIATRNGKTSKRVLQYDKNGNFIKEWPSAHEVERCTGLAQANISAVCRGDKHRNSLGGYVWKYAEN